MSLRLVRLPSGAWGLVAVPGDPLADLGLLAHPSFVMVGGRRVPLDLARP